MLKFGFTNLTKEKMSSNIFSKYVKNLYKIFRKRVDKKLFNRNGHIDLVLIDDNEMHKMNKEYRKKIGPTDVISFAYLEVTEYKRVKGDIIVGDIFISIDTAKKQAKKKGHDLKTEMAILFVHGLLHLFGFDHKTDKEETAMEKWAKRILNFYF